MAPPRSWHCGASLKGAQSKPAAWATDSRRRHYHRAPRPTFTLPSAPSMRAPPDAFLAPVENTLVVVVRVYDLLLETDSPSSRETILPIEHHLIVCRALRAGLRPWPSHPMALAQSNASFPPIRS